jgi:beta-lactamase class A
LISRRRFLAAGLGTGLAALCRIPHADAARDFTNAIAAIEGRNGGRLGLSVRSGDRIFSYRGDERFAMCSTFKTLAAACVLARVDSGEENLARVVNYPEADLLDYAPASKLHVREGMTVGQLCAAAVSLSDNTAANLLLDSFGGPAALTRFLRGIGDTVTRLDRYEPKLNDVVPPDTRDTTTPAAMAATIERLLTGDAIPAASRESLAGWMIMTTTGNNRLRAGLPKGWRVGDKTGTGPRGETSDVAIAYPPGRKPVVVAAYYDGGSRPLATREAVLADAARVVGRFVG